MMNWLKKRFYISNIEDGFGLTLSSDDEEVRWLNSRFFREQSLIIVKNEEIGKQIYDVVKALEKDYNNTHYILFDKYCKVYNYTAKDNIIGYIVMSLPIFRITLESKIHISMLDFVITISKKLKKLGYSLNKEKLQKLKNFSSFSGILACFDTEHREKQEINDNIIRCCHSILAPDVDFDDFYGETINNRIIKMPQLPYNLRIIEKCYQYFHTKEAVSVEEIFLNSRPDDFFGLYGNIHEEGFVIPPNIDIIDNSMIKDSNYGFRIYKERKGGRPFYCNNLENQCKLVFEDDIATHYEYIFNPRYNIKIYRQNVVSKIDMERKVNNFIFSSESRIQKKYMQDCFIPIEKLYNNDGIFIGYMYEKFDFEDKSVMDLEDKEKMKNLHRLKALIRLLMQIKALLEKGLGFSQNPYGNVFISKNHKRQVQLTNIEFIDEKQDSEKTIRWTYEYVTKVIASDENIDGGMDIIKESKKNFKAKIKDLDNLLEMLQNLASELIGYCTIHQYYNNRKHILCPKCIATKDVENIKVVYTTPGEITSQKEVGKGGEAIIYDYRDSQHVAKVFKEDVQDCSLKLRIMAKIHQKSKAIENLNERDEEIQYIIPEKLLIDESTRRFIGYTMEKVKGMPIASLKDKDTLSKIGFCKKDVLEILIKVGNGIEALHNIGIFIGDLNESNIFFDKQKRVYFLDFDGMAVDGISSGVYTEGYIDPMSVKNKTITEKDDWYSFAIQAFHYLVGTHPFNGIYIQNGKMLEIPEKMELRISLLGNHGMKPPKMAEPWDWMSAELKEVFYNTFEGGLRTNIVPLLIAQYNEVSKI